MPISINFAQHDNSADLLVQQGFALHQQGRFVEAQVLYEQALILQADHYDALQILGALSLQTRQFTQAVAIKPDYADAHYNRGNALLELRHLDAALESYEKAIAIKPDYAEVRWNMSTCQLMKGNFHDGWKNFEARARLKDSPLTARYDLILRLQHLPEVKDKNILIWPEQGLGDHIQFCRYIPELTKLGAKVTLVTHATLITLMETLDESTQIVDESNPLSSDFDFQAPLMSLPLIFKTEITTIPSPNAYLSPNPSKQKIWAEKLISNHQLRVGLFWNGGFRPDQPQVWATNERRNIPLEMIARLQHLSNIEFYSLQKGNPAESEFEQNMAAVWPTNNLINFASELKDFSDTAALISNLDLVISVDTSTAHLAAALGKPTWILNRYDACWRWLENRIDSPWYKSVALYRQKTAGDWGGVLDLVARDLKILAQEK